MTYLLPLQDALADPRLFARTVKGGIRCYSAYFSSNDAVRIWRRVGLPSCRAQ
jgi:hypothetical protein